MVKVKEFWNHLFGGRLSPVFLIMLGLSALMWYISKLDYTYTAEVPVVVRFEGENYRISCMAEGTGHQLVAYRLYKRRVVNLDSNEVILTPVPEKDGYFAVDPVTLQAAISVRNSDIRIISIGSTPEVRRQTEDKR